MNPLSSPEVVVFWIPDGEDESMSTVPPVRSTTTGIAEKSSLSVSPDISAAVRLITCECIGGQNPGLQGKVVSLFTGVFTDLISQVKSVYENEMLCKGVCSF